MRSFTRIGCMVLDMFEIKVNAHTHIDTLTDVHMNLRDIAMIHTCHTCVIWARIQHGNDTRINTCHKLTFYFIFESLHSII